MKIKNLLVLLFCFFMISCDDNTMTKKNSISELDYKILVGAIPDDFISYGPALVKQQSGVIEATVVFDSDDIRDYVGRPFSVTAFLTYYKEELERNDSARYLIEERSFWQKSFEKLPVEKTIIGDNNDLIGENYLEIITYRSLSPNPNVSDREHLAINEGDWVLFRRLYPPDERRGQYGAYKYNASIGNKRSIEYQVRFHSSATFSHEPFIYAKKFIENFYL